MPLSTTLGFGLLDLLEDYAAGRSDQPEVRALEPLLRVQSEWSAIPRRDELLVECYQTREGFHVMVFPFAGRILNEGVASLVASRLARESPKTFSITSNEYGFELLCEEPFEVDESRLRRLMSVETLLPDLLNSINVSDLARRQFRDIAQIAGLVDPGSPGKRKSSKQLQVSSGLMFNCSSGTMRKICYWTRRAERFWKLSWTTASCVPCWNDWDGWHHGAQAAPLDAARFPDVGGSLANPNALHRVLARAYRTRSSALGETSRVSVETEINARG